MDIKIEKVEGGVCVAAGFLASAAHAGIKRVASEKDDMALVYSEEPCVAAGVFTRNRVKAAPVRVSMRNLRNGIHHGVVLNSGNANACTGREGEANAWRTIELVARALGRSAREFLVCSTGRIGVPLPMEKMERTIPRLVEGLSAGRSREAAVAIMTSDTFPKESAVRVWEVGGMYSIGGIAKGAGMIQPDMATMLCVVTTDVSIEKLFLQEALWRVVERTFNRITVDGDMSTNDTVIVLANGRSGVRLDGRDEAGLGRFEQGLEAVCLELARMIVRDGEGTTRVIRVEVEGARNAKEARVAARAVANSVLLKCAFAGGDANWGRILDALGYSGARFDVKKVNVFYEGLPVVIGGIAGPAADTQELKAVAQKEEFCVRIELGAGEAGYWMLTTDMTEEYVRLNLSE